MSHFLLNGSPSAITDTVEVLDDVRGSRRKCWCKGDVPAAV